MQLSTTRYLLYANTNDPAYTIRQLPVGDPLLLRSEHALVPHGGVPELL
ncbi:MAG: hypothetical protein JWN32_3303 [Solirubrobacterales bacterium]|jgi:hypothetical protein|nr:hypothetical protein [Solirubrobacterales bacterium]